MIMFTRALRNASLSFFGAYDAPPCFDLPFAAAGAVGDALPVEMSHVLLRRCFGFRPECKGNSSIM